MQNVRNEYQHNDPLDKNYGASISSAIRWLDTAMILVFMKKLSDWISEGIM